jgi:hypothetical protein
MIEKWTIISTIELLLQIHKIRCILYIYASILEIFEKINWKHWNLFLKINIYLTKKSQLLSINMICKFHISCFHNVNVDSCEII